MLEQHDHFATSSVATHPNHGFFAPQSSYPKCYTCTDKIPQKKIDSPSFETEKASTDHIYRSSRKWRYDDSQGFDNNQKKWSPYPQRSDIGIDIVHTNTLTDQHGQGHETEYYDNTSCNMFEIVT